MATTTTSPARCVLVALAGTTALLGLVALLWPDLSRSWDALGAGRLSAAPFTDLLEWWCAWCALTAAAWLWGGTVLLAASVARGHRWGTRPVPAVLPAPLRRLVLLACGVALTGGLAAPALAASGDHPGHRSTPAALLDGLPLPDRPTGHGPEPHVAARPAVAALPAPAHRLADVVVRPGDTLWSLARDALPGPTGERAVAQRCRRIYALNRRVVGPDPDLIRPGEHLRLPHP